MDAQPLGGLIAYRSPLLYDDQVEHVALSRFGGVSEAPFSSLNVGNTVGDDPVRVEENLERILRALDWRGDQVVSGFQVHGDRVHVVTPEDAGSVIPSTDALLSDVPGLLLLGRYADCVPVLLFDPIRRVVGLAHAGWRGTVQRIAIKAVETMAAAYGSHAEDVRAVVGPSIGPCCFQVGDEVLEAFRCAHAAHDADVVDMERGHVNLWRANALQLAGCGVKEIAVAELCTSCHVDRFYSHRRENGNTGRFAVAIGLRAQ